MGGRHVSSPFRGLREPNENQATAIRDRLRVAKGLPRCERLGGTVTNLVGGPVPVCPCTLVGSPDSTCPYALRDVSTVIELTTQWGLEIPETDQVVMDALTVGEKARIGLIPAADRKNRNANP